MTNQFSTRYSESFNEGVDYTLENGKIVMTKNFHLKRGYCCGSGCVNCPWKTKQQIIKDIIKGRN